MNVDQIKTCENGQKALMQPKTFCYNLTEWPYKFDLTKNIENFYLYTSNKVTYNNFEL